jgi:DNA polymerase III subunit delta'
MSAPYPWQERQWQHLWSAYRANRLPHALLLKGPHGMGISRFAQNLTRALLCDAPGDSGATCNQCKSCLLSQAGNHPEVIRIGPEGKGQWIKIEQIRALIGFINLKSHYGHLKIALLDPAEAMNRHAANSLLKTLEEPPLGTLCILVNHNPMQLPATVRSRCCPIDFAIPARVVVQAWLAAQSTQGLDASSWPMFADEAPLTLLRGFESGLYTRRQELLDDLERLLTRCSDPLEIAQSWSKQGAEEILVWILRVVEGLIKLKATGEASWIARLGLGSQWHALVGALDLFRLFTIYDQLLEYRCLLASHANITALNLLEEFAIQWTTTLRQDKIGSRSHGYND